MKKLREPRATRIRSLLKKHLRHIRTFYLKKVYGYNLHHTTSISFGAFLDKTRPNLIFIGKNSTVNRGAIILSHDYPGGTWKETVIGENSFIGVNSVVLPGVHIGNEVVIGAGSIVTKDIESNSLAVGNPARILRKIRTGPYGRIIKT